MRSPFPGMDPYLQLTNRRDAWGKYLPKDQRPKGNARTAKGALTTEILERHFHGADVAHLIGLRQLATHWDEEFDTLCLLLAQAAIVYMDETGWKVGDEKCSLWAFASQLQRVFLFGCHKDDATLDTMLPPETFKGTCPL